MKQRYGLHKKVIKEKKESTYHRLSRKWNQPTYFFSSREFKVGMCLLLGLAVVFFPANAYYNNNILGHLITNPSKIDPFTTLWNGQIPSTTSSASSFDFATVTPGIVCSGGCAGSQTFTHTVTKGEALLVVIDFNGNGLNCLSVTDSQSNTFTQQSCLSYTTWLSGSASVQLSTTIASVSGSDVFTIPNTAEFYMASFYGYTNIVSITGINTATANTTVVGGNHVLSPTGTVTGFVFGNFIITGKAGVGTVTPNGIQRSSFSWSGGLVKSDDNTFPTTSDTWTWQNCGTGCTYAHTVIDLQFSSGSVICGQVGYQCLNTSIQNGNLFLTSNATYPAIALSNSSVSLATGVSKALAFSFENLPTLSGTTYGWFLRLNSTLPNGSFQNSTRKGGDANYSPLTDTSVALAVIVTTTSGNLQYTVYMQHQGGQKLAYPSCNQSSTVFICANNSTTSGTIIEPLVLNFTGASSGSSGSGQSYLCTDFGGGGSTCSVGGASNTQVNYINTKLQVNYTQPWLNIQNNYYMGLWLKAGSTDSVKFLTSTANVGQIISVFVPPTSTLNPNIAENGFLGWLKNVFISDTCSSLKALTLFLADPCTSLSNAPQDISTALSTGLFLVFTTLLTGFRTLLNDIGNFVGDGPIGDNIFSFFANMRSYFTSVFGTAITQWTNQVTIWIGILNAIVNVITLPNMFTILSTYITNLGLWIALFNTPFGDIMFLLGNLTYLGALLFIFWYFYLGFRIFWNGIEDGIETIRNSAGSVYGLFTFFFDTALEVIDMALRVKGLITRWL